MEMFELPDNAGPAFNRLIIRPLNRVELFALDPHDQWVYLICRLKLWQQPILVTKGAHTLTRPLAAALEFVCPGLDVVQREQLAEQLTKEGWVITRGGSWGIPPNDTVTALLIAELAYWEGVKVKVGECTFHKPR